MKTTSLAVLHVLVLIASNQLFAENNPFIRLEPKVDIQTPPALRSCDLDPAATHVSRAAELDAHAFKKTVELFGLVIVKHEGKLAVRAVTPMRIGNGGIGFSLEPYQHNLPFIDATEFTMVYPTEDSEKKILALVAKAAQRNVPFLESDDERLLAANSYVAIQARQASKADLSTADNLIPGDEMPRVFVIGHIMSWQENARDQNYLGYSGGKMLPLAPAQ